LDGIFTVTQSFAFFGNGTSVKVKLTILSSQLFPEGITFFRYSDPPTDPADNAQQFGDQVLATAFVWNRSNNGFLASRQPMGPDKKRL
jgi:hypothetical protein